MRKISIEDFINRASEKHDGKYDYTLIQSPLSGQGSEVEIICPRHGVFHKSVRLHLRGAGCPECGKIQRKESVSKARIKQETPERKESRFDKERTVFLQKANKIHNNFFDYSSADYRGCSVPVTIICPIHGSFQQKPVLHLQGKGCRYCKTDRRRLKIDDLISRMKIIHSNKYNYSLFTKYKNNRDEITIICPEHGEFAQTVYSHLRGIGCPSCGNIKKGLTQRWTSGIFAGKAGLVHGNKYDYSKVDYTTAMTSVAIICPRHGEFNQKPYQHMIGEGCPKCGHQTSKGEQEIAEWLRSLNFNVLSRTTNVLPFRQELDIYLPDNKVAIEYNGLYWHSSRTGRSPQRHLKKLELCEQLSIRLIQLWDCEWNRKKDICKEIILFALGRINKRLFARKCEIKQVPSHDANVFLENNHIQGGCSASFRAGLFYEGMLVGIQCFQAPNEGGTSKSAWLVARTAFMRGVQVLGGISRMFKYFIETVNPDIVVDYTDRRLFVASGHYAMGFQKAGTTKVCNYLTDGAGLYSRRHYRHWGKRHFRHKMPWDDNLSDTENLENNGWFWVWDCGKIKNVWTKPNGINDSCFLK
jgi:hypothetical protein